MRLLGMCAAIVLLLAVPAAAANRQQGSNAGSSSQSGSSGSGDAIGGPSLGVAHAGDVRVVATNESGGADAGFHSVRITPGDVGVANVQEPTSVLSGDAAGSNAASGFVGLSATSRTATLVEVFDAALT